MTTQSKGSEARGPNTDYVLRDEFLRFEQGITRWQEDTRAEQRAFQDDVRQSIRALTHEVRETHDKPTNWGWVLTGVATLATIAALIGGIAYTAIDNRQESEAQRTDRMEVVAVKLDDKLDAIAETRWSSADHRAFAIARKQELDRRFAKIAEDIDQLRDRIREHSEDGHPSTVLRELDHVRQIAERADERSERNSLTNAALRGTD